MVQSTLLGGVTAAAGAKGSWKSMLKACFTGQMTIEVEGGHKRADAVRVGDLLWSQHESDPDGAPALKVVEEVFERLGSVWVVRVQGQDIETTVRARRITCLTRGVLWRGRPLYPPEVSHVRTRCS